MAPRPLLAPVRRTLTRRAVPLAPALLVLALAGSPLGGTARALGPTPAPSPDGAVWPLDPQPDVASRFDPPASRWGAGHRGVDLSGTPGQPVRAARAGTVVYAGRLAGRGVVVVSHGRTRTTYEPVAASVRVGDAVDAGAVIGRLELLGSHCLPRACLHWGLLDGERYLDPLTLVGGGPVRLLPWLGGGHGGDAGWTAARVGGGGAAGAVPQLPGWLPLGQAALFRE
jgi:murein DD-endopeptidase MepM/ murein hydrolase activator NlpD